MGLAARGCGVRHAACWALGPGQRPCVAVRGTDLGLKGTWGGGTECVDRKLRYSFGAGAWRDQVMALVRSQAAPLVELLSARQVPPRRARQVPPRRSKRLPYCFGLRVFRPTAACSALPHTANWHHPDVNILTAPEFSMVDGLGCLPLEELYFEDVYFRPEHFQWAITPDQNGFDV